MTTSKREIPIKETEAKKTRLKKLIRWLVVDFTVAFVVFALLLYKPDRYNPINTDFNDMDQYEVSPYLTKLTSEIYNSIQLGKPFEINITEEGVNDIISRFNWPLESEGIMLYAPSVLFVPETVVLMGTADFKGAEFIITIELQPKIGENSHMSLFVSKVKVGAMNVTPLAKITAKRMYAQRISNEPLDPYAWQTYIVGSLLNEEPFEPVFEVQKRLVRIEKIIVEKGKLNVHMIPATR